METKVCGFAVLLWAVLPVQADEVWVGKLPYRNVQVTGCSNQLIEFRVGARSLQKPIEGVSKIAISGDDAFNRAENLFSSGKYAQAARAYEVCLLRARLPWKRTLARRRQLLAKQYKYNPPTTRPAETQPARRCLFCGGTSKTHCPGCRFRGRSTGRSQCTECSGKGRVICPDCEGQWRSKKCSECGGKGTKEEKSRDEGIWTRKVFRTCKPCNGTGYCGTCCRQAGGLWGTVQCPMCNATGFYGVCSTCNGSKKAPCRHCAPDTPEEQETPPTGGEQGPGPDSAAAGTTPEDLLKTMPRQPDRSAMTSLQAEIAQKAYLEKLRTWRDRQIGRKVCWRLRVEDVSRERAPSYRTPTPRRPGIARTASGITLFASSDLGTKVQAVFPESMLADLARLTKKDQVVTVTGEIAGWVSRGIAFPSRRPAIWLKGRSIDLAGVGKCFFGVAEPRDHNVFVVDRSGSMIEVFDDVRNELARSITGLRADQSFHVVFFSAGQPKELPAKQLVYATKDNKRKALEHLRKIQPRGQSDPIPALDRAFAVLKRPPGVRRGRVLYLLTDGDFPDNDKVVRRISELNARREVKISTVLHHFAVPGAMRVLKQIAAENGGRYRFVAPPE